jgi:hypothetical protein
MMRNMPCRSIAGNVRLGFFLPKTLLKSISKARFSQMLSEKG